MVGVGDIAAMATQLLHILAAAPARWAEESADSIRVASTFDNQEIARRTLSIYTEKWRSLRS